MAGFWIIRILNRQIGMDNPGVEYQKSWLIPNMGSAPEMMRHIDGRYRRFRMWIDRNIVRDLTGDLEGLVK